MLPNTTKIVLMIDADNMSFRYFATILYLTPTGQIVRYFASGQEAALKSWNEPIEKYNFKTVEAKGKDAADIAIEKECLALALKHPKTYTFCIASDDKGFQNLIHILRRWGEKVVVITKSNIEKILKAATPISTKSQQAIPQKVTKSPQKIVKKALPQALPSDSEAKKLAPSKKQDKEEIQKASNVSPKVPQHLQPKAAKRVKPPALPIDLEQSKRLKKVIEDAFAQIGREWVTLAQMEDAIKTVDNTFRAEDYGAINLPNLLIALPDFVSYSEFRASHWVRLKTKNE